MVRFVSPGVGRVAVALVPAGVGAAPCYAVLSGLGAGPVVATGASIALAAAGVLWLSARLPADLDSAWRTHTALAVLWLAGGFLAVGATARLHHSCLSAHFQSARL